jgi:hypothetical protein
MELSPGKKFIVGVMILLVLAWSLDLTSMYVLCPLLLIGAMLFFGAEYFRNRRSPKSTLRVLISRSEFLCDDCKWNYGAVCVRPERPNATTCPDYKRK